jgi:adenylate cyclase
MTSPTVLGDVVNVAARIEQATKRFGVPLVASEATVVRAGEVAEWQEVGRGPPRGRSGSVVMLVPSDQVIPSGQSGSFA